MFGGTPQGFSFDEEIPKQNNNSSKTSNTSNNSSNPDPDDYYALLGVSRNATPEEIRKAYKRLAVKHHPDKGGDEAKFKEITEAANVLMDESKREMYDKYGKKGMDRQQQPSGAEDLFSMFFGGGLGGQRQQQQEPKIAPIKAQVSVSLEALYLGKELKVKVDRKRICKTCDGSGSTYAGRNFQCDECKGQGVKITIQRIGGLFAQQLQSTCDKCGGTGDYIPDNLKCSSCFGKRISPEKKELTVQIEKGMKDGEQIVIQGEGHLVPKIKAGDVVVLVACQEHSIFTRKGNDLMAKVKVDLVESFSSETPIYLNHLDGRVLKIERPENILIAPGQLMVIQGEGMPKRENPFLKGDLFISFSVEFPQSITPQARALLIEKLSPYCERSVTNFDKVKNTKAKEDDEEKKQKKKSSFDESKVLPEIEIDECSMSRIDISQFGKSSSNRNEAYHDDDDGEEEAAPRVGCQQM